MATRDVTVTVSMDDAQWGNLVDAAECAGMSVEAYLSWGVRMVAAQAGPGKNLAGAARGQRPVRRKRAAVTEPAESAWTESFSERLSLRAEPYREV
ncbi:hypothetical protein [Nocardia sp. NPDC048505]|uniref:hypothetical protein n=1 Tax=unclassified Nocardia TaxID=2637762 RepID=UPI0033D80EE8